mgnify:CR=1 FL=1
MKTGKKKVLAIIKKVISILLFFVILLYSISKVGQFARPDESDAEAWAEYYAEEKDTVNALMIGSSAIFRYWNPPQAYEEQDFTSAMLASSIQDLNMAPYIMEEAVKSQNVDVFVIEVRTMIARNTNDDHSQEERDYWFELLISGMNPSITRLQAIQSIHGGSFVKKAEMMFQILKYHNNLMEFDREFMINRLNNPSSDDKFARPKSTITNLKNKKPDYTTNQSLELSQASKDTLDAIEKKANELGKKVLFIATPYVPDESQIREHLAVDAYCKKQGYDCLDLNQYVDEMDIDFKTDFYTIIALIIVSFVASATQDIATDALAVLSFSRKDKSLVNSMQSMGSFGGSMIGGGVLLLLFKQLGWNSLLPCVALFVIVALLPLLFNRGLEIAPKDTHERAKKADVFYFFTQKNIWKQIGFLFLYYSGLIGTLAMLKPYLVDLGYSMKEIGVMSGVIGTSFGFIFSFVGGFIVRRIGRHWARILFAVFVLLATLYFLGLSYVTPTLGLLHAGIALLWGSYGMATIVVYTTAMDCVRLGREGTDFTIQTVITHLSGMVMAILSGKIADHTGYHGLFFFEVSLAALSLVYILIVFRKEKETV